MTNREAIRLLKTKKGQPSTDYQLGEALQMAISALEKQEQSCDTCRHGRFGSEACIKCRVRFPSHYEAEEES